MGVVGQKNINNDVELMQNRYVPVSYIMNDIRVSINQLSRIRMENLLDSYRDRDLRHTASRIEGVIDNIRVQETRLNSLFVSNTSLNLLQEYKDMRSKLTKSVVEVNNLLIQGSTTEARRLSEQQVALDESNTIELIAQLSEVARNNLNIASEDAYMTYLNGIKTSFSLLAGVLLVSFFCSYCVYQKFNSTFKLCNYINADNC